MENVAYRYRFTFPDGGSKEFVFQLDGESLTMARQPRASWPAWTKLTFQQCPNCPLHESASPQCPVAANLADMVDFFKEAVSSDTVELEISNEERSVAKKTSMANAISALLGVIMVTSGCPIMDKLRPMVRTHLPFSNIEETMYRTLTMYLMAQYFIYKRGGKPDWDMERITVVFDDIRIVNRAFCQRLYGIASKDASVNAVIHLDSFVELTNFALVRKKDRLERLEKLFAAYLDTPPIF